MVAKIKIGKSLIGALNYNENKVKENKATLLMASGYSKDAKDLNFHDKLARLTDLAAGNERTKTNTVHISLNFAIGENLDEEKLQQITNSYMERLGFGEQPYLVYQHHDAGHPHIHIVATNITPCGERIDLNFIGKRRSEPGRKAIEIEYGLVKAEEQQKQKKGERQNLRPAEYGKSESKRAITNIVGEVIQNYKFTSIPELNAVLNQYNIAADRGSKDSRMFAKNGLVYWILDGKGNKTGVPIKASSIYGKPTLKKLETNFRLNEALRKPLKEALRKTIDEVMRKPRNLKEFQQALQQKNIQVVFRRNDEGRVFGVTFVDQNSKAVFNGSDLGKAYSASILTGRLNVNEKKPNEIITPTGTFKQVPNQNMEDATGKLLDILFQSEQQDQAAINKFKKRKKTPGAKLIKYKNMQTGENEQALRKIMDFTRLLSIAVLIIHFYLRCYPAFVAWHLAGKIADHILLPVSKMGIFKTVLMAKASALVLLAVSLVGTKGKRDETIRPKTIISYVTIGLLLYFISNYFLALNYSVTTIALLYISLTTIGYFLFMNGGGMLFRMLKLKLGKDIFNRENESFPQEERLLENEYSINLPAIYNLKGKERNSWINIINPFRGTLILGNPGSGKSHFVMRHIITQHISKGFAMLIYDFKYDDLSKIAYNALFKYASAYPVMPKFCVINLEKIMHRCNPLEPETMFDITDAIESSRTIMLGLNREWIKKQGDFFVESPINFVTALMWFLKKFENGRCCTLPHVIELCQVPYPDLFAVLAQEPEVEVLINPFVSAFENEAFEQLEGQVASAKISLARLSSPLIYYVLSGSDFSLDINNPDDPKILCLANNPQKSQTFGPVLSLINNRVQKLVNRKAQLKCCLTYDEFSTLYASGTENLLATGRSNLVALFMALQDFSQLKKDYGRDQAEVIMNITGNMICGQVTGDTAKQLSERFGKINQVKESVSINATDTSVSKSTQLDYAIPASKIASLSSGEFAGMVADDPTNKIELKVFHNEIQNDHTAIKAEEDAYEPIPDIRHIDQQIIMGNYQRIKEDIKGLVESIVTTN